MPLTFRPLAGPDELHRFTTDLPYVLDGEVADDLAAGRRRPGWIWIATDGDRLVAKAAWWSRAGADRPYLMDFLDFADGRADAGEELVRTALAELLGPGETPPEYLRFVAADWRTDPGPVEARMAVLERLGATPLVERHRLEWRPEHGVPARSQRLRFRPFAGPDEALRIMTVTLEGTLDAHHRADLTRMTPAETAAEHFHGELERWPSPQDWWQVATRPDGEPVGFVFPARNDYGPIIAYIGVLPAHRGHGYIDDILAEGTHILAGQGAPRIRANTDVGNGPMAKAFARAGYDNYQNELNMVWGG